MRRAASTTAALSADATYTPIASLLRTARVKLQDEVIRRVRNLDRADLLNRYRTAYDDGKRLIAYFMANELIERRIPPCFWHELLALENASVNQRGDLVTADLAWLRRWHRDHAKAVRYQRGKAILTGTNAAFLRESEFAFYGGRRAAWQIVGSMSMTEHQQWSAAYLRSAPIKKQVLATAILSRRVRKALDDDLQTVRRTVTFGDADAGATRVRRYTIWLCSRMVKSASPTEIAARYTEMTGLPITRQVVSKQLEKVRAILKASNDDFLI